MKVLAVMLLLLAVAGWVSAITLTVPAQMEQCIFEDIEQEESVTFAYQVVSGGFLDIDVHVLHVQSGDLILSRQREKVGRFTFTTEKHRNGIYQFCFGNMMSSVTPKAVDFTLHVGQVFGKVATVDDVDPLESSLWELADGLEDIEDEIVYFRNREKALRNTAESTNERVLWFSVLEYGGLICMSLWQIYNLKRFFEVRRSA
eukprot:TRINITY_DN12845_c0_g1_i3.p1 TRINITY_DN12845_c0_g1~~TRINITY_DN12845_c0_g1_i3.p1  ORF type:complete len:215 (-),score=48.94 TRINITY_DN12845_c0_g1_i3:107-712(-)